MCVRCKKTHLKRFLKIPYYKWTKFQKYAKIKWIMDFGVLFSEVWEWQWIQTKFTQNHSNIYSTDGYNKSRIYAGFRPLRSEKPNAYWPWHLKLVQLQKAENGDTIAVIDTSIGQIKAVLYPQYSQCCQNLDWPRKWRLLQQYLCLSLRKWYLLLVGSPNKDGTLPDNYDKSKTYQTWTESESLAFQRRYLLLWIQTIDDKAGLAVAQAAALITSEAATALF